MSITASVQPESGWIVYAGSDSSFLQKRHGWYFAKPTRIWSGWSGQGLAKHIWSGSKLVCRIIGPGFWQDATVPLPVFYFQTRFRSFTDVPDNIVQNQPGSGLVLADCVRFWPNGSGPEASRCARVVRPTSGQWFSADPDLMRIVSGKFTGIYVCAAGFSPYTTSPDMTYTVDSFRWEGSVTFKSW